MKKVEIYTKGIENPFKFNAKFVSIEKNFVMVQRDDGKDMFAVKTVERIIEGKDSGSK